MESPNKVFIGNIILSESENMGMVMGIKDLIPDTELKIPLKFVRDMEKWSDFLNVKYPLISNKLKNIIEEEIEDKLFYRKVYLNYKEFENEYYYVIAPKIDCIDFTKGGCELDDDTVGGVRFENGFTVNESKLDGLEIFKVNGLTNRKLVISENLKKIFDDNEIKGIKYIDTKEYKE